MTLSLTNRCNFRCEYCEIPLQHREEMTTSEWIAAIDDLHSGGMGRASLIGGEPLVRKDCGEIISHLKKRGIHAAMNTNGWFVRDRYKEIEDLDLVCITLDGPKDVHDRQRHAGSYERAIDAIELLRSRGKQVVTMTVLTPASAESMDHVLDVAKRLGYRAYFQLEHDKSVDVHAPIARFMTDNRIGEISRELLARKAAGLPVGNSETILKLLERDGRRIGGGCEECYAGRYYGYILSDGTVAPCLLTQWQPERGNGRKHGFLRAFDSLSAPEGPGCSCVPTHEVNRILDFDIGVLFHALDLVVRSR